MPVIKNVTTTDESVASACESVTDFKYFQKHPSDPTKYIQCDPWGSGRVRECGAGLVWNEWALRCDDKEVVRNMTKSQVDSGLVKLPTTAAATRVNCTQVGLPCVNGGYCVQALIGSVKCVCTNEFTGQFCESRVDFNDITHEVLNGTFSVVAYRERLQKDNITLNMSYYERYKGQLDNATYTELVGFVLFSRSNQR